MRIVFLLLSSFLCALAHADTPDRFARHLAVAEMHYNQGDYAGARRWLQSAGAPPGPQEESQLLLARATLHLVDGNLTAAKKDLVRASAAGPSAATLHLLASVEAQSGDLARAELLQRQALSMWQQSVGDRHEYVRRAWISLSTIQGLRRQWSLAEQSLRIALDIAETPEALQNYAIVLEHCKRRREAKAISSRLPKFTKRSPLVDVNSLKSSPASPHQVMVR